MSGDTHPTVQIQFRRVLDDLHGSGHRRCGPRSTHHHGVSAVDPTPVFEADPPTAPSDAEGDFQTQHGHGATGAAPQAQR